MTTLNCTYGLPGHTWDFIADKASEQAMTHVAYTENRYKIKRRVELVGTNYV